MKHGKLVIAEGISRCGKSSLFQRNSTEGKKFDGYGCFHPYNNSGAVGQALRETWKTLNGISAVGSSLGDIQFYASLGCHLAVLRQAVSHVRAGKSVYLDRSILSTYVYNLDKTNAFHRIAFEAAFAQYMGILGELDDNDVEFIFIDCSGYDDRWYTGSFASKNMDYKDTIGRLYQNYKWLHLSGAMSMDEIDDAINWGGN